VVIAGWETNICCDSTARAAFFYGYRCRACLPQQYLKWCVCAVLYCIWQIRVIFLSDGTDTSDGEEVHNATVKNMDWIAADAMTCKEFEGTASRTLLSDRDL